MNPIKMNACAYLCICAAFMSLHSFRCSILSIWSEVCYYDILLEIEWSGLLKQHGRHIVFRFLSNSANSLLYFWVNATKSVRACLQVGALVIILVSRE